MDLKTYLAEHRFPQSRLARELGVTAGFVWQLCARRRCCPISMALRIERWSAGKVTRADLRADWREIWPEYSPPQEESATHDAA